MCIYIYSLDNFPEVFLSRFIVAAMDPLYFHLNNPLSISLYPTSLFPSIPVFYFPKSPLFIYLYHCFLFPSIFPLYFPLSLFFISLYPSNFISLYPPSLFPPIPLLHFPLFPSLFPSSFSLVPLLYFPQFLHIISVYSSFRAINEAFLYKYHCLPFFRFF